MHSFKAHYLLVFLFLPLCSYSIDLKNNACHHLGEYHIAPVGPNCYYNPDVLSNVMEMSQRHGYEVETNTVTTKDGYILTVFKIESSKAQGPKKPMFIQHGIATNSGPWVDIGNRSIAFYFADKGYTVYLGNVRGSTYSQRHVTLNRNSPKFWDYRLDDIAAIDIPAQLEYVFQDSGQKAVYVGHSMGTTISFMFASAYPDLAGQYIERIFSLAPVAYLDGAPGIVLAIPIAVPLLNILDLLHIRGLVYHEEFIHKALTKFCYLIPAACRILLDLAFGKTEQFASEDLMIYYSYWPSGTSIYQLKQYLQIASSKKFQMYDYGPIKNKVMYGSLEPPTYPLEDLKLPIHLFYGENDSLYRKKNMRRLYDELGSLEKTAYAAGSDIGKPYDHIDFMYSKYIVETLYEKMDGILSGGGGATGSGGESNDIGEEEPGEEEKEEEEEEEEEDDDDKDSSEKDEDDDSSKEDDDDKDNKEKEDD